MAIPNTELHHCSKGILYGPVLEAENSVQLQAILAQDIRERSWVKDSDERPFDPSKPFIVYPPMNIKREAGVAILVGKLAKLDLGLETGAGLVLIAAPESATWMGREIAKTAIFPHVELFQITKDPKTIADGRSFREVPVLSYVHKRRPDGSRGTDSMYFVEPQRLSGKRVLLLDDVIAEGETVIGMAEACRNFGASRVDVAVVLSKLMQGGSRKIRNSGFVDHLVEGARIAAVRGPGVGQLVFEGEDVG